MLMSWPVHGDSACMVWKMHVCFKILAKISIFMQKIPSKIFQFILYTMWSTPVVLIVRCFKYTPGSLKGIQPPNFLQQQSWSSACMSHMRVLLRSKPRAMWSHSKSCTNCHNVVDFPRLPSRKMASDMTLCGKPCYVISYTSSRQLVPCHRRRTTTSGCRRRCCYQRRVDRVWLVAAFIFIFIFISRARRR